MTPADAWVAFAAAALAEDLDLSEIEEIADTLTEAWASRFDPESPWLESRRAAEDSGEN